MKVMKPHQAEEYRQLLLKLREAYPPSVKTMDKAISYMKTAGGYFIDSLSSWYKNVFKSPLPPPPTSAQATQPEMPVVLKTEYQPNKKRALNFNADVADLSFQSSLNEQNDLDKVERKLMFRPDLLEISQDKAYQIQDEQYSGKVGAKKIKTTQAEERQVRRIQYLMTQSSKVRQHWNQVYNQITEEQAKILYQHKMIKEKEKKPQTESAVQICENYMRKRGYGPQYDGGRSMNKLGELLKQKREGVQKKPAFTRKKIHTEQDVPPIYNTTKVLEALQKQHQEFMKEKKAKQEEEERVRKQIQRQKQIEIQRQRQERQRQERLQKERQQRQQRQREQRQERERLVRQQSEQKEIQGKKVEIRIGGQQQQIQSEIQQEDQQIADWEKGKKFLAEQQNKAIFSWAQKIAQKEDEQEKLFNKNKVPQAKITFFGDYKPQLSKIQPPAPFQAQPEKPLQAPLQKPKEESPKQLLGTPTKKKEQKVQPFLTPPQVKPTENIQIVNRMQQRFDFKDNPFLRHTSPVKTLSMDEIMQKDTASSLFQKFGTLAKPTTNTFGSQIFNSNSITLQVKNLFQPSSMAQEMLILPKKQNKKEVITATPNLNTPSFSDFSKSFLPNAGHSLFDTKTGFKQSEGQSISPIVPTEARQKSFITGSFGSSNNDGAKNLFNPHLPQSTVSLFAGPSQSSAKDPPKGARKGKTPTRIS